jgi:hypothetical protein
MPKFQVIVRYYVPAYARIDVQAETQAEADNRVRHEIATHGIDCHLLTDVEFTADWQDTNGLSVVKSAPDGLLHGGPETRDT